VKPAFLYARMRRIWTTIRIILQKYLSLKKYPQIFLSVTFSKKYMVNALSGDRYTDVSIS
jgi:hypothetical protein